MIYNFVRHLCLCRTIMLCYFSWFKFLFTKANKKKPTSSVIIQYECDERIYMIVPGPNHLPLQDPVTSLNVIEWKLICLGIQETQRIYLNYSIDEYSIYCEFFLVYITHNYICDVARTSRVKKPKISYKTKTKWFFFFFFFLTEPNQPEQMKAFTTRNTREIIKVVSLTRNHNAAEVGLKNGCQ